MMNQATQRAHDTLMSATASFQVALIERREQGATAVEYALMVGLLIITIISGVSLFSSNTQRMFETYANTLPG
jgi:Flp pilus assembly pilin Flp